jgi:glycosyltransferase involved in cell wall biosynthesis
MTVSKTTRSAIMRRFPGVDPGKITVTHSVPDDYFYESPSSSDLAAVDELVGGGQPFVLVVGNQSPHKNHFRAVQAFAAAAQVRPDLKLVMVRRFVRRDRQLRALLDRSELRSRIVLMDHVKRGVLRALFHKASVFLFPSWIEGFGLPILEAMAAGCPVITSDRSAPVEVAADAALKVSPFDVQALSEAVLEVLEDSGLRGQLIERGRRRAREFSWDETARRTLAVYRRLIRP